MKKSKPRDEYIDDGHSIADMSGIERQPLFFPASALTKFKKKENGSKNPLPIENDLDVWKMSFLVLRTVMPFLFIFLGLIALFILFCQFVWFK